MNFPIIYTSLIVITMTFLLVKQISRPEIVIFTAFLLLILGKVITVDEALKGFSNKAMLTVAFLFVISAALESSGTLEIFISKLFGSGNKSPPLRYLRLMFPVSIVSAFLNNTPVVATLIPIIKKWCKKVNLPISKFLIPLSYAAILGGTCTLIGTSTNLVVQGMMLDSGIKGFTFFELTKVGLPVAILGILFISFIGYKLLPSRKDPIVKLGEGTREFVVEMKVTPDYPMLNKTIEEAHLRHLQGLFLFQINRKDKIIAPVSHDEKILAGDRLFFTGLPDTIYELQKTHGLITVKDPEFDPKNLDSDRLNTYEVVISNDSPLIGQSVRESNFRGRYGAVILAIHRSGTRINKKVGDIVFKPGDTLFILAKKGFDKIWYNSRDFSLVSPSIEIYSKPRWKGNLALGFLGVMVILSALRIIPIVLASALTAVAMVICGIIHPDRGIKSINWSVLLIIASALGIGKAIENSGLASLLARHIILPLKFVGPVGVIGGIFLLTSLYASLITNNAAAAIIFPIALSSAHLLNIDPRPLLITLTIGASASFATPIGYQTNLMVYGPGGYRFSDFLKIGIPMTLVVGIGVTILTYFIFFVI